MWRRQKSDTSPIGCNWRKGNFNIFLNPRACREAELRIFLSPRASEEARAWNFSKSQGPYRYGSAKSNISTYSFIFSTYSFIFTTSRNSRMWRHQRGKVHSILKLTPRSWAGNFSKSPDIFPNVTSSGGGRTRKSWYYLVGRKTWNMSKE